MNIKIITALFFAVFCFLKAESAFAKVSAEKAALLGSVLTPMGAQKEGNENGTIPAYTGKIVGTPFWVDYQGGGQHYPNCYANEKPIFTITASNYQKYSRFLTPGLMAMFERYPQTFRMPIYTSHRDAGYSDTIHANTAKNAVRAELMGELKGVVKAFGGTPFPLPNNGAEAIWNQSVAPMLWDLEAVYDEAAVFPDGKVSYYQTHDIRYFPYYDEDLNLEKFSAQNSVAAYVWRETTMPFHEAGMILAIQQPMNFSDDQRKIWVYSPGSRRVRRAPDYGYDLPYGHGGLRTVDDDLLFNGPIDRFDWVLEGKREIFIPYHSYDVDNPKLKYKDLLTPFHVDPKYMRYELHRVWVVHAYVKSDKRHIYHERVFFLDEDSWHAVYADNYDAKGNLWRTHVKNMVNAYDMPGMVGRLLIYHDLTERSYYVGNLINQQPKAPQMPLKPYRGRFFTPQGLRMNGRG